MSQGLATKKIEKCSNIIAFTVLLFLFRRSVESFKKRRAHYCSRQVIGQGAKNGFATRKHVLLSCRNCTGNFRQRTVCRLIPM